MNLEKEQQQTRKVPAVTEAEQEAPAPRRRRADRYKTEAEQPEASGEAFAANRFARQAQPAPGSAGSPEMSRRPIQRPDGAQGESMPPVPSRNAGMRPAARPRTTEGMPFSRPMPRERVGYASGRMQEGDARAALRGAEQKPVRTPAPAWAELEEEPKKRRVLPAIVAVLLVIGLAAIGIHLIPDDAGGFLGAVKQGVTGLVRSGNQTPGRVLNVTPSGEWGNYVPTDISFGITTTPNIHNVRLVDENGNTIPVSQSSSLNSDHNAWTLVWSVTEPYEGVVTLQVLSDDQWSDTEHRIAISVKGTGSIVEENAFVSEAPTESPKPEENSETLTDPDAEKQDEAASPEGTDGKQPGEENPEEGQAAAGTDEEKPAEETPGEQTAEEAAEEQPAEGTAEAEAVTAAETMPAEEAAAEETPTEEPLPEETPAAEEPADAPAEETAAQDEAVGETVTDTAESIGEAATEAPEQPQEEAAEEEEVRLTASACEAANPDELIKEVVIYNGTKKANDYSRPAREQIHMPLGDEYTRAKMGVLTFRNDAFRQNAACGTVNGAAALSVLWKAEAGSVKGASQTYYGIGYVGQPAIVKWSKQVREMSNMDDTPRNQTALKEVIVGGLDGNVYFLNLADGKETRNTLKIGYPMKGSASVHPGGAPYMNIGQYARKMARGTGKIGLRQVNLYTGKEMNLIDGLDGKTRRGYNQVGSFETSSLMDRTSDTLITAGTNGMLYVINMGTTFDYKLGTYVQSPSQVLVKMKAKGQKDADTAVEASVAAYDKYVYYADMAGILRCLDTDTMRPVWAVSTGDAVESTPALELAGETGLRLYTANLVSARKSGSDAEVRCYDALTGEEKWKTGFAAGKDKKKKDNKETIGFRASPVVGRNGLDAWVYYTVNGLLSEGAQKLGLPEDTTAALIALNKEDGSVAWARGLSGVGYSSPVAVYDESGKGWIIQCAGDGSILLLDGATGQETASLQVEGAIEGSPAVYNDIMVVGTTERGANYIYGIQIQ